MAELSEIEISNKKLAAGLLGIFLGSFGIHKFVLGYNNAGIIMLVVSLARRCGDLWRCHWRYVDYRVDRGGYLPHQIQRRISRALPRSGEALVLMASSGLRRSASTALLSATALFSTAALIGHGPAGFHPVAWAAAVFPLQCVALVWAWQRRRV